MIYFNIFLWHLHLQEGCKYEENEKFSLYTELELSREKNDELQSDNGDK